MVLSDFKRAGRPEGDGERERELWPPLAGCADAGDLRLLQVKLSLQRSETADDGTWKASVVAAAAQSAQTAQTGGVVSTSLPQLQMRDWDQWG